MARHKLHTLDCLAARRYQARNIVCTPVNEVAAVLLSERCLRVPRFKGDVARDLIVSLFPPCINLGSQPAALERSKLIYNRNTPSCIRYL